MSVLTVKELIKALQEYPENFPVYGLQFNGKKAEAEYTQIDSELSEVYLKLEPEQDSAN